MTETLFDQGLSLLIFGVSVVFVFLTLLVILTTVMSKAVNRFFPEPVPEPVIPKKPQTSAAQSDAHITAISAAVHKYRQDHPKK
ncbi:MAG: OadG family protein [Pseudomonadales bacterium]